MKYGLLAITVLLQFVTTQSFAEQLLGWDSDAAMVFEMNASKKYKKSLPDFEYGRCTLTAQAGEREDGSVSVVVRYITSKAHKNTERCQLHGKLYGIFNNCDGRSIEFSSGAICSRQLPNGSIEKVRRDGLSGAMQLIEIPAQGKNKYTYFSATNKWVTWSRY